MEAGQAQSRVNPSTTRASPPVPGAHPPSSSPHRPATSQTDAPDPSSRPTEGARTLGERRVLDDPGVHLSGSDAPTLPAPRAGLLIDDADLQWIERIEALHLLQARLPGMPMTTPQREATTRGVLEKIERMSRDLVHAGAGAGAQAGAAEGKHAPGVDPGQDPATRLDTFLKSWPPGDIDRAQARRTGRAAGLRLGGGTLSRKQRQELLAHWAGALSGASEPPRRLALAYFMQGFAWALAPRPSRCAQLARDMADALCQAAWTSSQQAKPAADEGVGDRFLTGLRGLVLGLGGPLMSCEVLRTLLETLDRPADRLAAADARRWLGIDGRSLALFNLVDAMGGPQLPKDHLGLILDHLLRSGDPARAKCWQVARLVEALGGTEISATHRRMLLEALAGPGLEDRATRQLLLRELAVASCNATGTEAGNAFLIAQGAHLPPASLWRLVEGLVLAADGLAVLPLPELLDTLRATMAQAAHLDLKARVLVAGCLGHLGRVQTYQPAGFDELLVSLEKTMAPGEALQDALRGLRLARDPQWLWRDRQLGSATRQSLFEAIAQVPGILTPASTPRVLARLLQASLDGDERRACVSLLFLHGAQHLPLTAFTTVRVLLTLELMALVESGPLARAPGVESAVPKGVLDAYLRGLGDLTALFEMLLPSRQLEFACERPPDPLRVAARRKDIEALRDYLRAQLRQVGRLGEPAMLREAMQAILRAQLEPLEQAFGESKSQASSPGHR